MEIMTTTPHAATNEIQVIYFDDDGQLSECRIALDVYLQNSDKENKNG